MSSTINKRSKRDSRESGRFTFSIGELSGTYWPYWGFAAATTLHLVIKLCQQSGPFFCRHFREIREAVHETLINPVFPTPNPGTGSAEPVSGCYCALFTGRNELQKFWALACEKALLIDREYDPSQGSPVFTINGKYSTRGWTEWTQGFQYGIQILTGEILNDSELLKMGDSNTRSKMRRWTV